MTKPKQLWNSGIINFYYLTVFPAVTCQNAKKKKKNAAATGYQKCNVM